MNIIDLIKSQADINGDGKVSKEDLEALKDGKNNALISELKKQADRNKDGKLDVKDLADLPIDNWVGKFKKVFSSKKK